MSEPLDRVATLEIELEGARARIHELESLLAHTQPVLAEVGGSGGQFAAILERIPSMLTVTDVHGAHLYVTPNCKRITGYDREELLGKFKWWVHDDDLKRFSAAFMAATASEDGSVEIEYKAVRRDGEVWYASSNAEPLRGKNGKVQAFVMETVDITRRRLAFEALRLSEERFRAVADHTFGWEWWLACDGSFLYCSPSCQRITGYTAEELIADPSLLDRMLVAQGEGEPVACHLCRNGFCQEGPVEQDFPIRRKDGEIRWLRHRCHPLFAPDGSPLGRRGSNQDITERRAAEEALRRGEERFRTMAERISEGLLVMEGPTPVYANDRAAEILGWPAQELFQQLPLALLEPEERSRVSAFMDKIRPLEELPEVADYWIRTQAGERRCVRARLSVAEGATPGRTQTYILISDVTAQKERERQQEALLERLAIAAGMTEGKAPSIAVCASCHRLRPGQADAWQTWDSYVEAREASPDGATLCPGCASDRTRKRPGRRRAPGPKP